jgi:uncharacterized DUF497 family protein
VDILWDENKNKSFKAKRGISFEDVAQIILDKKYLAIYENPTHPEQMIFILRYKSYAYVVPFIIEHEHNIVLKTIFPSRKFHKPFQEEKE